MVGLSSPRRLDALVTALQTELPDALFAALEELSPPREHWLDFQQS